MRAQKKQFLVDEGGRKTAVVLPVTKYRKLLEDLHDLAVVAERRQEEPIDLQEIKQRLKGNGRQFNSPG
jgi:hypothetical protein